MSKLLQGDTWTEAEYLAFEAEAAYRYEFIDGRIIERQGASANHSVITGNIGTSLVWSL